jgi:hypothetical protein
MNDLFWQNLRYLLIALGTYLVARGKLPAEQVTPFVEVGLQLAGALIGAGAWAWGVYVKKGTTAVPDATAARKDVPTVSAVTGATIPGSASK